MRRVMVTLVVGSVLFASALFAASDGNVQSKVYNPFVEIQKMQQEIDQIFKEFHTKMVGEGLFSQFPSDVSSKLAVDLVEKPKAYLLKVDIPGVKESDIKISTKDHLLTLEAKTSEAKEEKAESFLKKERFVGSYFRALSLPKDADMKSLKSDYHDGVLTITIAKKGN